MSDTKPEQKRRGRPLIDKEAVAELLDKVAPGWDIGGVRDTSTDQKGGA